MSIWVIILLFKSGAVEPMFAYPTEDKCKAELVNIQQASKDLDIKAECRAFKGDQ